mgnify:CR=1 FL=1
MLIIGHEIIPYEDINIIKSVDDIKKSKTNSTVLFDYNIALMDYCMQNNISYGVYINDIKSAVFANSLHAKYLLVSIKSSLEIQKIANEYMFDAKVLEIILDDSMIESVAKKNIDGIIYENCIKGMI